MLIVEGGQTACMAWHGVQDRGVKDFYTRANLHVPL
jgi:hypothetical protein